MASLDNKKISVKKIICQNIDETISDYLEFNLDKKITDIKKILSIDDQLPLCFLITKNTEIIGYIFIIRQQYDKTNVLLNKIFPSAYIIHNLDSIDLPINDIKDLYSKIIEICKNSNLHKISSLLQRELDNIHIS